MCDDFGILRFVEEVCLWDLHNNAIRLAGPNRAGGFWKWFYRGRFTDMVNICRVEIRERREGWKVKKVKVEGLRGCEDRGGRGTFPL